MRGRLQQENILVGKHALLLEVSSRTEKGFKDSECPLRAGRVSETPALPVSSPLSCCHGPHAPPFSWV